MSDRAPSFRLGLVQTHADEDPASNIERTVALIHKAADQGAEIVVTQELFASRYFCQTDDDAHFALSDRCSAGFNSRQIEYLFLKVRSQ